MKTKGYCCVRRSWRCCPAARAHQTAGGVPRPGACRLQEGGATCLQLRLPRCGCSPRESSQPEPATDGLRGEGCHALEVRTQMLVGEVALTSEGRGVSAGAPTVVLLASPSPSGSQREAGALATPIRAREEGLSKGSRYTNEDHRSCRFLVARVGTRKKTAPSLRQPSF